MIRHVCSLASTSPDTSNVLFGFVVILTASGLLALLMTRLRQATIPGYVLAGAIIGPNALGWVADSESVESISNLATILLMFSIGLHMELSSRSKGLVPVTIVGAVSTLLSAAVIAVVSLLVGLSLPMALTVGLAMSMSSTAVVARILSERRELRQLAGRISFTILLVQDILAVAILAAVPMIAAWSSHTHAPDASAPSAANQPLLDQIGAGSLKIGLVIGFLLFGKCILPRIMHEAARVAKGEIILIVSAAVAFAAAGGATLAGLSPELGAFVAGLLLAATPFRHQVVGQLEPMRDLFLAIFFASVGLKLDPAMLAHNWLPILIGVIGLVATKAISIGLTAWTMGAPPAVSATVGLSLSQAGEFSLVVLGVALTAGVLDAQTMGIILPIVVLSLVCTPWLMAVARSVSPKLVPAPLAPWSVASSLRADTPDPHPDIAAAITCRAVIAGFGPVGRAVADRLDLLSIAYTIIELNPRTVETQRAIGRSIIYGDASNREVLEAVRIEGASVVVLAIPDDEATIRACRAIRQLAPDAFIAARAGMLRTGMALKEAGASIVAIDEIAAAESLTRDVVERIERIAAPAPLRQPLSVEPTSMHKA
ncbi:MAG: cation:proton antiporter [Phycisphaeraceae bacterium]|nr:cation:proton antiporter [Phycisphaeraceae bacterium]